MDCNTEVTMGKRISTRRKALGMTQDQLAAALGVSPQAVSKWENDQCCPDISILPELARVIQMTTDALLGITWNPEPENTQEDFAAKAEPKPEEELEQNRTEVPQSAAAKPFSRIWSSRRLWRRDLVLALWLICVGVFMLIGQFTRVQVGLWTVLWTSGIFFLGIGLLVGHYVFPGLIAAIGGAYLVADRFQWISFGLSWQIVLAILFALLGLSLLFRRYQRHNATAEHRFGTEYHIEDGFFDFSGSFGEEHYTVVTPMLRGGNVSASFGEFTLDLTRITAIADSCEITVQSSFGETVLLVPRQYRVILEGSKSFGAFSSRGEPDAVPQGVIHVSCSVSFGETCVRYV